MFVLILKEIFEVLYDSPERENTSLKMSMFYHKGTEFIDLLIGHGYPLRLIERENNEVFPLGTSEVVITNLRTGFKILKSDINTLTSKQIHAHSRINNQSYR